MSGTALEDTVAEAFKKTGYIVFTRSNHCDVLAVKPDMSLAYLVECKDYTLSRKQQLLAVRELNRNYTHALELLIRKRLCPERILKVLVAKGFAYQARGVLQYTPETFIQHVSS
ncbi:MAG: restriction endonuclease [Candidatus Bathyarchaeales archaeon]